MSGANPTSFTATFPTSPCTYWRVLSLPEVETFREALERTYAQTLNTYEVRTALANTEDSTMVSRRTGNWWVALTLRQQEVEEDDV